MNPRLHIREIRDDEFDSLGRLMVEVYSGLEGFPTPAEQPKYYEMLANIGRFTERKEAKVLVAISNAGELVGGVVYFGDMSQYGSGGSATTLRNTSGIRLLGVGLKHRGAGAGRALTNACIELARKKEHSQVVLHTTQAMQIAWRLYEQMGFQRSNDLDFMQENLPVFGFRLRLD
ncbi:MAG: GNAT family N-acetyltransferase [Verrucomicrobia bacterium]|nr:GNAT family N-acetyltransferase [Verrucomicrobiota bacterium]